MIADAIDAAISVGWALAAWIVLTAVFATAALYAVVAAVWWLGRWLWAVMGSGMALCARLRRERPSPVPESPESTERPSGPRLSSAPSWARTD